MTTSSHIGRRVWKLPPLIIHPFSDSSGPTKVLESSRASLMLKGLLPPGNLTQEELYRRLLAGRYCEIRMLYYVGKDVVRWIEQCLEFIQQNEQLRNAEIKFQSFAALLIDKTPKQVKDKLLSWGVPQFRPIFSRSIGLNSMFAKPPARESLSDELILNCSLYTDQIFSCRQKSSSFAELDSSEYDFGLYASGEYTEMIERDWKSH